MCLMHAFGRLMPERACIPTLSFESLAETTLHTLLKKLRPNKRSCSDLARARSTFSWADNRRHWRAIATNKQIRPHLSKEGIRNIRVSAGLFSKLPLAPEESPLQRVRVDFGVWAFAWSQD